MAHSVPSQILGARVHFVLHCGNVTGRLRVAVSGAVRVFSWLMRRPEHDGLESSGRCQRALESFTPRGGIAV
jgi:hypothetical protein